jgi:hypothetical protein
MLPIGRLLIVVVRKIWLAIINRNIKPRFFREQSAHFPDFFPHNIIFLVDFLDFFAHGLHLGRDPLAPRHTFHILLMVQFLLDHNLCMPFFYIIFQILLPIRLFLQTMCLISQNLEMPLVKTPLISSQKLNLSFQGLLLFRGLDHSIKSLLSILLKMSLILLHLPWLLFDVLNHVPNIIDFLLFATIFRILLNYVTGPFDQFHKVLLILFTFGDLALHVVDFVV